MHSQQAIDVLQPCSGLAPVHGDVLSSQGHIDPQFEDGYCSDLALAGVLAHKFTFNGECHQLPSEIDWLRNPSRDIEWQILLHKFYFAPGLARKFMETADTRYRDCFESLVRSWIGQTPVNFIATDVTARRVQNWIYAGHIFSRYDPSSFGSGFAEMFTESIAAQLDAICDNMAPARNHRTLELYAVFLGSISLADIDRGRCWRTLAVDGMSANIRSDLLADGVHCELSTDYHHIVLRSYLLFYRLALSNNIALPADIAGRICKALDFAMHIHRPDGHIPALSDSDSRSFVELLSWGAQLFGRDDYDFVASTGARGAPPASSAVAFNDSGYVVLRSDWRRGRYEDGRYLVFDCGPVGAGNHGHLDALSIEAAAYGQTLVMDPGRYTYNEWGDVNWRARFRRTSAHNTVTVDGCDQAIYQRRGKKLKIRKPHPVCTLAHTDFHADLAYVHGYVRSPNYEAIHHRHIWFVDQRYWLIVDHVQAASEHDYALRFQLAPRALGQLRLHTNAHSTGIDGPGLLLLIVQQTPTVCVEPGYVSTEYGIRQAAPRICARETAAEQMFVSLLYPVNGSPPRCQVRDSEQAREVIIVDGDRHDRWLWNLCGNEIGMRRRGGPSRWQLAKEAGHG